MSDKYGFIPIDDLTLSVTKIMLVLMTLCIYIRTGVRVTVKLTTTWVLKFALNLN